MDDDCRIRDFIARMRSVSNELLCNNKDGVAIVQFTVILNRDGNPQLWWVNNKARIEPSNNAREVIAKILSA